MSNIFGHTSGNNINDEFDLYEAEKKIGCCYKDRGLLFNALTHSSYANEHRIKNNERLEFLGDSVLSVIISDYIFKEMANKTEGDLSKFRASIVCEQALAQAAKKIGLNELILLGRGEDMSGGRNRPSILSDAYEAVIASIYIDRGMETAQKWVLSHLKFKIDEVLSGNGYNDYKSILQEKVQKGHTGHVTYETLFEKAEEGDDRFGAIVRIDGKDIATGTGRNKKDAEQMAAKTALELIKV